MTDKFLFIISHKNKIKTSFTLKSIKKLKHSPDNNFVGIEREGVNDEIFEIFKKQKFLNFIIKKSEKLGSKIDLKDQDVNSSKLLNESKIFKP